MKKIALLFVLAMPVLAQTPKAPPVIPIELKEKLYKAQAESLAAQAALEHAQQAAQAKGAAFQAVVARVQESCGKDFTVNLDKDGEVVCVANPEKK